MHVMQSQDADLDALLDRVARTTTHQLAEGVALLGGSVALLRELGAGGGDEQSLRALSAGLERVRRFVEDLFELTGVAARAPEPERLDLADELARRVDEIEADARAAGVEIELGQLPPVEADRQQLASLLSHLLRAALASRQPRGGRIEVLEGDGDGRRAEILVRDNGRPLSDEQADALFDPFAPPRGRGPLVGAGVGMTVCRRIVEAHRGTIWARQDGATFTVGLTLPRGAPR